MAQRMESAAPPGGVMLSESTARLVEDAAQLGERQLVRIKGSADPVPAHQLLAMTGRRGCDATLVHVRGPRMGTRRVARDARAVDHRSRMRRQRGRTARHRQKPNRGRDGESRRRTAWDVRSFRRIANRTPATFRSRRPTDCCGRGSASRDSKTNRPAHGYAARLRDADPADLILLQDELGIRDPADELPDIAPEARRRRLTALVNATVLARPEPALYVIEDAHWIDSTSEALLADFLAVIPRTSSMAIVTYRPEYAGALSRSPGAQTIALAPLDDSQIGELDRGVARPASVGRRAGRPHRREGIGQSVLRRGDHARSRRPRCPARRAGLLHVRGRGHRRGCARDACRPPSPRESTASHLRRNALSTRRPSSVCGSMRALLTALVDDAVWTRCSKAELVDQVAFTPRAEYAFHHPLIRTVAYRSQLTSARAELHRRLARLLEARDPESVDEQRGADRRTPRGGGRFGRGILVAHARGRLAEVPRHRRGAVELAAGPPGRRPDARRSTWPRRDAHRAARPAVCDRLPHRVPPSTKRPSKKRVELADAAGDKVSLAMAMSGRVLTLTFGGRYRESSRLASELVALVESIGDPMLELTLLPLAAAAKLANGELTDNACDWLSESSTLPTAIPARVDLSLNHRWPSR